MTQYDRHPTTEQLSAFLDGQLSSDERSQWDAHLKTCEQCQQELADLRLTVNLLHALPQPELPRSFALPVDAPVTPIAAHSAGRAARGAIQRRRSWPTALRTTARSLCAIAAMFGIFLLFSGLLVGVLHAGNATPASMSSSSAPEHSAAGSAAPSANSASTTGRQQPAARPEITPAATPSMGPYAVKPGPQAAHTAAASQPNPLQSVLAFFDMSTTRGSIALGLLLLLLGALGFILLPGRPKERAP